MTIVKTSIKKSALRERLRKDQWDKCALCGLDLSEEENTLDHKVPKKLGGSDKISNLQAAHAKCNWVKGHRNDIFTKEDFQNYYLGKSATITHYKSGKTFENLGELRKYLDKNENNTHAAEPKVCCLGTHEIVMGNLVEKQVKKEKPITPVLEIAPEDKNLDKPALLWNEIVRNGTKRLSYEMFKSYFV